MASRRVSGSLRSHSGDHLQRTERTSSQLFSSLKPSKRAGTAKHKSYITLCLAVFQLAFLFVPVALGRYQSAPRAVGEPAPGKAQELLPLGAEPLLNLSIKLQFSSYVIFAFRILQIVFLSRVKSTNALA